MSGLSIDTCLQCEQTRAQVKEEQTICATVGGYEYVEIMDEWPKHHWRDWSDAELASINPEHRDLYRRASLQDIQYAACEHTPPRAQHRGPRHAGLGRHPRPVHRLWTEGDVVTAAEIRRLIRLAERLGFQDDVEHWKAELAKLEANP